MSLTSAYRIAKNSGYNGNQDEFADFIKNKKNKNLSNTPGFNWDVLVELQNSNYLQHIYKIGDVIHDTYTDPYGNEYDLEWVVVDFKEITYLKISQEYNKKNEKVDVKQEQKYNAMIIQSRYAFPQAIQFDNEEPNNTNINRSIFGNGNYSYSAVRQYINSDKNIGEWWVAQHKFDNECEQSESLPGFLQGFSEEFKKILKPIKIITQGNMINENKNLYITYDKLWLPSLDEMAFDVDYIETTDLDEESPSKYNVIKNTEGNPFTYWIDKINDNNLYTGYWGNKLDSKKYQIGKLDDNETPCNIWLRSTDISDSDGAWYINENGNFNNGDPVKTSHYIMPCCAIFKVQED